MMCYFPLWVDDWAFPYLDDAITRNETNYTGCIYQFMVRPLITVVVNIVGNLSEQNPFIPQHSVSLAHEWRERMRERVAVLLRGVKFKAKPLLEILLIVFALIRNMRRIVDDHVITRILKWHVGVVPYHVGVVTWFDVEASHRTLTPPPESSVVYCCVQNFLWAGLGIKIQHSLQQFRVIAEPNGRKWLISFAGLFLRQIRLSGLSSKDNAGHGITFWKQRDLIRLAHLSHSETLHAIPPFRGV